MQVIRWAQAQFPALLPGGVVDTHPLRDAAGASESGREGPAMTSTVQISDATKRFGEVEAVQNVSFALEEGETIALVGHNGAGKTTLLKLMLGLIRPTSGTLEVLGQNPRPANSRRDGALATCPRTCLSTRRSPGAKH